MLDAYLETLKGWTHEIGEVTLRETQCEDKNPRKVLEIASKLKENAKADGYVVFSESGELIGHSFGDPKEFDIYLSEKYGSDDYFFKEGPIGFIAVQYFKKLIEEPINAIVYRIHYKGEGK